VNVLSHDVTQLTPGDAVRRTHTRLGQTEPVEAGRESESIHHAADTRAAYEMTAPIEIPIISTH
jgi:hypothetical protein